MNIDHSRLRKITSAICIAAGSPPAHANQVADLLVEANLQGHDSHGVGMLPVYIRNIKKGLLQPGNHAKVVKESGSFLILDGQFGFGQVVGPEAMDHAIRNVAENGICIMSLKNAHHLGRIGGLAEKAAGAGLISIHFVNVVGINPLVAPFGGAQARMGTNPFCCAIPVAGDYPLILDMATSTIALGKARVAFNSGNKVIDGSLIDHEGASTDDPAVMFTKPAGALTFIGQHKGFGLALIAELLAGALAGQWTAQDEHPRTGNVVNHMFTVLFDPTHLESQQGFVDEATKFIEYVRQTLPAKGIDSVMIPGEPERKTKAIRLKEGIQIDEKSWQELLDTASTVGLTEDMLSTD